MILNNEINRKNETFCNPARIPNKDAQQNRFLNLNTNTMMTIEQIYNQYHKQVFNAVRQMVKDSHYSEDVTQMVFVKVNKYLHTFDESKANFNTWLYNITQSVVYDFFRTTGTRNSRQTAVSDFQTAEGNDVFEFNAPERTNHRVETQEMRTEILKAFRSLKPEYRKMATLYFLNEKSYEEVAEIMSLPLGSVKGMISRIRKNLQTQLQVMYRTV